MTDHPSPCALAMSILTALKVSSNVEQPQREHLHDFVL